MPGLNSTLANKISRRYGQAVFALAKEKTTVEDLHTDVVFLSETLKSSPELRDFIADPHHPAELNQAVLNDLFKMNVQPTTFEFLMFLVEKGRLNILSEILNAIVTLYQAEHKIGKVEIISASALSQEQVDAICKKLSLRWKHEFIAETRVDPSLIGGFQIKAGDQVLDYSMKNQLENFRRQIINS